jgi:hypothetical protein
MTFAGKVKVTLLSCLVRACMLSLFKPNILLWWTFMKQLTLAAVALGFLSLATMAADQNSSDEGNKWTDAQKKAFEKLRSSLQAFPAAASTRAEKTNSLRNNLRQLLSMKTKPAPDTTDALADSLAWGLNHGGVNIDQSLNLSKQLAKVLDLPVITYNDTNQFAHAIDPIVQSTNLGPSEKMQIYRQALLIVQSAPTYSYNQP